MRSGGARLRERLIDAPCLNPRRARASAGCAAALRHDRRAGHDLAVGAETRRAKAAPKPTHATQNNRAAQPKPATDGGGVTEAIAEPAAQLSRRRRTTSAATPRARLSGSRH
ncbi:hypothetical protein GCM10009687_39160 [Asanoa iriomotensis]